MLGEPDNYIPANPLSTPAHIVPEWYFWPFYAILRAFTQDFLFIPAKLWGVLGMFSAILMFFFLPWLDTSPVRSNNYRPLMKQLFWIFVVDILVLGVCGGKPAGEPWLRISQIASAYYFIHWLISCRSSAASRSRCRCRIRSAKRCSRSRPTPARRSRSNPRVRGSPSFRVRPAGGIRHMVKLIAFLVGAVFCVALLWGAVIPRDATPADPVAKYHLAPKEITWQNDGIFGTFDRAQLQRGYQVYKEICSGCHSINRVAFRNLTEIGFTPAQVKALAKQSDVATIDDKSGDPTTRKGIPADKIPGPYPNRYRCACREQQCAAAQPRADHQGA